MPLLFKEKIVASWLKEKNYTSHALSTDSASNAPKSGRDARLTACVLHASFDRLVLLLGNGRIYSRDELSVSDG